MDYLNVCSMENLIQSKLTKNNLRIICTLKVCVKYTLKGLEKSALHGLTSLKPIDWLDDIPFGH